MHQVKLKSGSAAKAQLPSSPKHVLTPAHSSGKSDAGPVSHIGNQATQRVQQNRPIDSEFGPAASVLQGRGLSHPGAAAERQASALEDRLEDVRMKLGGLSAPSPSVGGIPGSVGHPLRELLGPDHSLANVDDLSQVQVHDDDVAHAFTRSIGAKAATLGSHVYFGRDRFDPQSQAGQRLLAHELVHTMQPEANSLVHRSPDDSADLQRIDAQLRSVVITDEYRAELQQQRAAIVARPQTDLRALAREAARRSEASARYISVAETGPSRVTVPLSAIVTVPESIDAHTLFDELTADPGSEKGQAQAAEYVADQYLTGKLDWPVTVDLVDTPDGVWFNFAAEGKDLVTSRRLELPLSALDIVSPEPLSSVAERAAQIVEVATLTGAFSAIVEQIGSMPEDMIENPQQYARSETIALMQLVKRYIDRLNSLSASLLPPNAWLNEFIVKCRDALLPILERVQKANEMTAKLHEETLPGRYAGELYDQAVEESSNWVERWGWKFWRFAGDAVTLGGQSAQAENAAMYRRGEISLNAYRKNWVLAIGKVGFKAAMLALTGGRATGPAMRLLGLEGESVAATVVAGQAEGLVGGFVDAVSSDLYSKAIATFSSSPGVVAFHERSIVGPMGWIESASWGGVAGGGASLLGSLLPKAPKPSKLPQKTPIEPGPSLSEGMPPAIKVINADMRTGDVTISVRDLESGEMFMAEGNVHTGNATVTNMSTGEVVGYVREDTFAAAPEGAFSTGESSMAEAGVTSLAETDLPAAAQAPPMPKELRPGQGPPTAFARGTAPRTPAEVTKFLRDAGLEESEIISFGGEHARHLGSRSAGRVAQLAERFTAADLKALGEFLWEHEIVIDDELTEMFIDRIETGQMAERLATIESRAEIALMTGTKFDLLNEIRLGVVEPRAPRLPAVTPEMTWPKLDPAWEMAQKQAGPAIEKKFGAGAEPQSREIAPGARPGESLGSTVPEYVYRAQGEIIRAFEVKRLRLDEMGIGPMGQRIGPPSEATVEAIIRARAQLGGRRWVLPPGCEQHIIFNVTGQGVTDVVAVGKQIKAALLEGFITYDHVWVQVGYELTEIN
jgi:hypothetical protein